MIGLRLVLAAAGLISAAFTTASPATDARLLYTSALHAMSNLPQPEHVTYGFQAQADGLQVDLMTMNGAVWLNVHGGSAPADWTLNHQTDDYVSEIVDNRSGRHYESARSFFDPTWYGAYRALREGMFDSQDAAPPRPQATATPPAADSLKTISVEAVMGPGIYAIQDRGSAACSNGDPGRALHLTSRARDSRHQLTDVVIDVNSMRFCMMRFAETSGFGFHGFLEQHYSNIGEYWMQTDGLLDGTIRAFGIALHHGVWRYQLVDMRFARRT